MTDNKDTLIIDLDNTLTQAGSSHDYSKKLVNKQVALAVNNAISLGYASKIFSARNMRSFKGDMAKIESVTRPIAEAWLYENNIEHDELILGCLFKLSATPLITISLNDIFTLVTVLIAWRAIIALSIFISIVR